MNKAKKMLLAGFLACTMLATSAALTACGDTSDSSNSSGNSSTSKPEAWELENATVSYTIDKDGVETANYTVKGKNGEEYTKSVATGRKVVETWGEVRVNGEVVEEPLIETTIGNEPKVEIYVSFDDESEGWVTVTDEMYIGEKPDYTKAGLYTVQFKLVDRYAAGILVTNGEPVTVHTQLANESMGGMCVLWDKEDVVAGTYDVSTVFWMNIAYMNGEVSQAAVNVKADQIKPIDWTAESEEGVYNFSVTDENGNSGVMQAYVLDEDSETVVTVGGRSLGSLSMMEPPTIVKGSAVEDLNTEGWRVMEMLVIGTDVMGMRMVEVPETAVYTLDTSACGDQTVTATWTVGEDTLTATASVLVYESKEEISEVTSVSVNSYKAVESGVLDMSFEVYSYTEYTSGTGEDKIPLMSTNYNNETVVLTADMIKGTAPDFTTAGVKVFTVEIGGNEYTYAVELWEEEKPVATTTNVAAIELDEPSEEIYLDGDDIYLVKDSVNIEVFVRKYFVNKDYKITYIEPLNGSYEINTTLKVDAFDWSAVKMDTVGEYALKVSYEGYEKTFTVNVVEELPEVQTPEMIAMFDVWDFEFAAVILYANNTADLRVGFGPYAEIVNATYTLDETTGTLEFKVDGKKYAIGTIVVEEDQIVGMTPYTFGEPTAEYNVIYFGEEQTLKLYEEGYGACVSEWGFTTFSGAYTLENGLLTIGDKKFYIQGTGADAKVIEVMQDQNG